MILNYELMYEQVRLLSLAANKNTEMVNDIERKVPIQNEVLI